MAQSPPLPTTDDADSFKMVTSEERRTYFRSSFLSPLRQKPMLRRKYNELVAANKTVEEERNALKTKLTKYNNYRQRIHSILLQLGESEPSSTEYHITEELKEMLTILIEDDDFYTLEKALKNLKAGVEIGRVENLNDETKRGIGIIVYKFRSMTSQAFADRLGLNFEKLHSTEELINESSCTSIILQWLKIQNNNVPKLLEALKGIESQLIQDWTAPLVHPHIDGSEVSSGFEDDADTHISVLSDINDDAFEDNLVEKVKELLSHVPLTIREQNIRARVKQFSHAKQTKSSHELMEMIIDIFKEKASSAETTKVSFGNPDTRQQQDIVSERNQEPFDNPNTRQQQDKVSERNQEPFDSPTDEEWASFVSSGNKNIAKKLLRLGKLPKQTTLDEICLLFKRKSKVTSFICKAVCEHIKSKHESIIDVWAAYTLQNTNKITFVVSLQELDKANNIRLDKMIEYSFIKRIADEYSYESIDIINHNKTSDEHFNGETCYKLRECVARYSVELMEEHKYLSVVSACSKRSMGYGSSWKLKPEICIVLYVHTKHYIPIDEDPFKTHYDGIPVDVREGAFIPFGRTADDEFEHVQMGCQICGEEKNGKYVQGTLGCFLDHPQYRVCGVTCAHVILEPWDLIRLKVVHKGVLNWPLHDMCQKVYQPSTQHSSIGHTVQLVYKDGSENNSGMEIALFKLTSRHPKTSDFPDASNIGSTNAGNINYEHWRICDTDRLNSKMTKVVKFGSKTEFRYGNIIFDRIAVKTLECYPLAHGYFNIKLHKQIEVSPQDPGLSFAENGDSGALVFLIGDNSSEHTCIGIVEGGTTYRTIVVTPIVPILEELNVSSLKSFDTENTLSEIHKRIDDVGNEVHTVGSEIQAVRSDVQTVNSEVQRMRGDMQSVGTEMQRMGSDIQVIGNEIQGVQTVKNEVQAMRGDIQTIGSELQGVQVIGSNVQQIHQMLSTHFPPQNTQQSPPNN